MTGDFAILPDGRTGHDPKWGAVVVGGAYLTHLPKITAKEGDWPPSIWRTLIFDYPCAEMKCIGLKSRQI